MRITIIGAGNVATHLGSALKAAGHELVEIWSRTQTSADELAQRLECCGHSLAEEPLALADAECYIISVKDDALEKVASLLIPLKKSAIWLHTAGTMPLDILQGYGAERIGVLYPMQTFSKSKKVDFGKIPIFIEGHACEKEVEQLAQSISPKVYRLDSEGRKHLHLAAVFACNFANHCYTLSAKALEEVGIPFDVMLPLIEETADKVHKLSPKAAQTGPAIRSDKVVMARQLALIKDEGVRRIYETMSQSIQDLAKT